MLPRELVVAEDCCCAGCAVGSSEMSGPAPSVSAAGPAAAYAGDSGLLFTISSRASWVLPGAGGLATRLALLLLQLWP